MNVHRRLATTGGVLLALALTVTGCTSSGDGEEATSSGSATSAAPAEPEAQPIEWSNCDDRIDPLIAGRPGAERNLSFQCGTTTVPVSYDDPSGGTLELFLVK